ncbi:MAG: hypothetical protein ACJATI_002213 [Halioglobus sp.]|jgi:hypothetical protein
MQLSNYRKESSERSDAANWAKHQLISDTNFFFDGIEGCNQNANNQTTHLFERAQVDIDFDGKRDKQVVLSSIIELETENVLQRKINFATTFGLPLLYVLHNDQSGFVFVLEFRNTKDAEIVRSFRSYEGFGQYLAKIKGWKSTKKFREYDDLPHIDKVLRKCGTPWPTNIDCFCSDEKGQPIAIIEYQNAKAIGVLKHNNNDYFLCKQKSIVNTERGPKTIYHDDIRRWTSLEILRVQSGLPLVVITWSQIEAHFQLKEIETITFPDFEMDKPEDRWSRMSQYKKDLHRLAFDPTEADFQVICNRKSMSFSKENNNLVEVKHVPTLTRKEKTFPHIYWKRKAAVSNSRDSLAILFMSWFE